MNTKTIYLLFSVHLQSKLPDTFPNHSESFRTAVPHRSAPCPLSRSQCVPVCLCVSDTIALGRRTYSIQPAFIPNSGSLTDSALIPFWHKQSHKENNNIPGFESITGFHAIVGPYYVTIHMRSLKDSAPSQKLNTFHCCQATLLSFPRWSIFLYLVALAL